MGKIATQRLGRGDGWSADDVVCQAGPQDRPFEEQHTRVSIAVVLEGSFQYRSSYGSELMSPGSLLLGQVGHCFECGHEHGTGDRCLSFQYTREFFDRVGATPSFRAHRIPPVATLAPWVAEAKLALRGTASVSMEELAHGLAAVVLDLAGSMRQPPRVTAADERRVSTALRFIEAKLAEPLPLERLAAHVHMSDFHFLRTFRQVAGVTPHQYILRSRLRAAAVRLKSSLDPVVDIALDAGFGDLSNFNHAFRAEFGASPVGFRGSGKLRILQG